jgi:hypothetical protein
MAANGFSFLRFRTALIPVLFAFGILLSSRGGADAPAVRYEEGTTHGFLVMRSADGKPVADGEELQHTEGDRVVQRVIFHFRDGSSYDETSVFTQHGQFRLLSDHLKQQGPSFKTPLESSIDTSKGQVEVRYKDDGGQEKSVTEKMDIPSDVANGMLPVLVKNIQPGIPRTVSLIVTTPKPRIVKVVISVQGQDQVAIGNSSRKATKYDLKIVIGGITGAIAKIIGKQPPDTYMWILPGEVPAWLKAEGPLYEGGPIWQTTMAAPTWPK